MEHMHTRAAGENKKPKLNKNGGNARATLAERSITSASTSHHMDGRAGLTK
jgi:hypothetical protein